jgi:hypothetical protein
VRPGTVSPLTVAMALAGLVSVAAGLPPLAPAISSPVPLSAAASAQTKTADPVGHLVGQAFTFCSWAGVPFDAVVERAEWGAGPAGNMHVVLVVQVTHSGGGATGAYITIEVRDDRGRVFEFARAGSGVDVLDLAREYGVLTPTMPVQAGRPARHLWAFVVPPDVQTLTIVQNPLYHC